MKEPAILFALGTFAYLASGGGTDQATWSARVLLGTIVLCLGAVAIAAIFEHMKGK